MIKLPNTQETAKRYADDATLKRGIYADLKTRINKNSIYEIQTIEEYNNLESAIRDELDKIENDKN